MIVARDDLGNLEVEDLAQAANSENVRLSSLQVKPVTNFDIA